MLSFAARDAIVLMIGSLAVPSGLCRPPFLSSRSPSSLAHALTAEDEVGEKKGEGI